MPNADEKVLGEVISFLNRQKLQHTESEEQYCTKVNVRSGAQRASVSVYNTGRMSVQGPPSQLKTLLEQMKQGIETGGAVPGQALPFEIELFPQTVREKVSDCDPVIIGFLEEAIQCYKAEALLGCAFMIGAASERAIGLLIQAFGESIADEANRNKFFSKVNGRMISVRYEEFDARYRGCKSKPTDPILSLGAGAGSQILLQGPVPRTEICHVPRELCARKAGSCYRSRQNWAFRVHVRADKAEEGPIRNQRRSRGRGFRIQLQGVANPSS